MMVIGWMATCDGAESLRLLGEHPIFENEINSEIHLSIAMVGLQP